MLPAAVSSADWDSGGNLLESHMCLGFKRVKLIRKNSPPKLINLHACHTKIKEEWKIYVVTRKHLTDIYADSLKAP